jgi:tellurite resistance protein TehA-like permease
MAEDVTRRWPAAPGRDQTQRSKAATSVAAVAIPEYFAMVMATGIVAAGLRQDGWQGASDALVVIAAAVWVAAVGATLARLAGSPADLRADARAPRRAFAWYAVVAACVVLSSDLAALGRPGRSAAAVLAALAVVAWLLVTGLVPASFTRRGTRPDLQSVTGSWLLWAVATQSVAIAAAILAADGDLPATPAVIVAIVAWSAGVALYLGTSILVAIRLARSGPGPAGTRAAYWVAMGAGAISVLAAALIVRVPGVPAARDAGPALNGIGVVLWCAGSALYLALVVATARWQAQTRSRPGYQPYTWVIVFPLGMYAVASWQLGTATGLTLLHQVGSVAVWPAALAWAVTAAALGVKVAALCVKVAVRATHAVRAWPTGQAICTRPRTRTRPRPLPQPHQPRPAHPAGMQRYTFEALVSVPPPGANPVAPVPGPDWHGVIRARADDDGGPPGLFSALVSGWDLHASRRGGDAQALATIVAFGSEPAVCLPVGGTFALWRGQDVARGVVTRRIFG